MQHRPINVHTVRPSEVNLRRERQANNTPWTGMQNPSSVLSLHWTRSCKRTHKVGQWQNWGEKWRKKKKHPLIVKLFPALLTISLKHKSLSVEPANTAVSFQRLCMFLSFPAPRQSIERFFTVDSQAYKGPPGNKSDSPMSLLQSLSLW